MSRHFPVAQPALAFTASQLLGQAGNTNRSLYVAEVLRKRVPNRLPAALLPTVFRRLLFPFRYSYPILRESNQRGTDPFLLAAVIREESRFDPQAFSAASARGLTQFVLPTARRVAATIGLPRLDAEDLHRPEVSITLGAAYLAELGERFAGKTAPTIAAYNAGEPQAELWQRYCKTDEPEEYLAKIAFGETRAYVVKVLTSQANYAELYGAGAEGVP
ncbi:MAG: lytic transglycosylase domain-containing protein [Thermoanaerobaculia bacterium]|nr:lytic transglycosylase domain-containing protein [Thermoanaerobaculia bacterium]